jgi:nucleoside-diphosphate-sugar epimerase
LVRVLLTGGTGYLGREIARALARRGHESVIFARSAREAVHSGVPGLPFPGDVRDAAALERAARGCDALCHTAAMVTLWRRNRREFDEVNVGGLRNALAAATAHRLPRVLYTSSFLALPPSDGRPLGEGNDYQRTKRAAESVADEALARGVPLVKLYPGVVYGQGVATEGNLVRRLVCDHLRGRLPGIIGADRVWSFAYVTDVADAHVSALERTTRGFVYHLGGDNLPQIRIFELLREATGRPLPRRLHPWLGRMAGSMEELRARFTNTTPLLTRGTVEIFEHDWALDSGTAIRELDYHVTPLAEGFESVLRGVLNLQP